ncbi:hypothetical protein U1Q18_046053 [Sarracenia purpurea var. burkii]
METGQGAMARGGDQLTYLPNVSSTFLLPPTGIGHCTYSSAVDDSVLRCAGYALHPSLSHLAASLVRVVLRSIFRWIAGSGSGSERGTGIMSKNRLPNRRSFSHHASRLPVTNTFSSVSSSYRRIPLYYEYFSLSPVARSRVRPPSATATACARACRVFPRPSPPMTATLARCRTASAVAKPV